MSRHAFTLVEVVVAVAVLAIAGTALQRLVTGSLRTVTSDLRRMQALDAARTLLAETTLRPVPGADAGTRDEGLRFAREVRPTAHPRLLEVRIRVEGADGHDGAELVELVYAPPF